MATSLIQLLCRMTKLGWFEDDAYRGLADEARNFLEKGTAVSCVCVASFRAMRCLSKDGTYRGVVSEAHNFLDEGAAVSCMRVLLQPQSSGAFW